MKMLTAAAVIALMAGPALAQTDNTSKMVPGQTNNTGTATVDCEGTPAGCADAQGSATGTDQSMTTGATTTDGTMGTDTSGSATANQSGDTPSDGIVPGQTSEDGSTEVK
ncbi:hypothetical protein [Aurantimonas sp. VKM B-3413]|uniref:hypothetical protein n=1 Tax=Aurantimonas sp. VKM B-3413 TaxID=2779401 RepID=UPI001E4211F0|nr:hypothetical protein [Aurantimonas sp. VKM B-3413]MCB8836922.1 hypothetical protein [Aurantimonas sp. VKM B-3413]